MSGSTAPTRLAFAITELDRGGAELAFVRLVCGLDRDEWEPRVYCLFGRGELAQEIEAAGIDVEFIDARSRMDFGSISRLTEKLTEYQPELLQTFLYHANLVGRLAALKAKVSHVVCGVRVAEKRSRLRLWLDRFSQRHVDRFVCVSESVAEFSRTTGKLYAEKIMVIPNGIDVEQFASATPLDWTTLDLAEETKVILVVGRLDEQKRSLLAYDAAAPILREQPDTALVYAGIGPLEDAIQERATEDGLSPQVRILGTRHDVPALMRGAKLLLHPSAWEGSPNVIWEAHAALLPVLASDIPGNNDALSDGQWGTQIEGENPQDFTSAIRQILESKYDTNSLFFEKSRAAQTHCREERSWERMVSAYADLYRSLLE